MNINLDPDKDKLKREDLEVDKALRPQKFKDFEGQDQIMENLEVFVQACMALQVWVKQLYHILLELKWVLM